MSECTDVATVGVKGLTRELSKLLKDYSATDLSMLGYEQYATETVRSKRFRSVKLASHCSTRHGGRRRQNPVANL